MKILAYYINLDRREDRNKDALNNIKKLGFSENNIKRFSAIDGKKLIIDLQNRNYYNNSIIKILQNKNIKFNACELACMLSHYFCLDGILNDDDVKDDDIIFMFEDDFFINDEYLKNNGGFNKILTDFDNFYDNFNNSCNNFNNSCNNFDWDLIFFGGRFKVNFIPLKLETYYKKTYGNYYEKISSKGGHNTDRTTHNYVVKKSNIYKICDVIFNNYVSIDSTMQIDNLFNHHTKHLKIYDYFPHIFYSPADYKTDIQKTNINIFI